MKQAHFLRDKQRLNNVTSFCSQRTHPVLTIRKNPVLRHFWTGFIIQTQRHYVFDLTAALQSIGSTVYNFITVNRWAFSKCNCRNFLPYFETISEIVWVNSKKTYSDQMEIVVHMWFPFLLVICVIFSHFSFPMLSKSHHSKFQCHYSCTIIYLPAFSTNLLLVHLRFLWYLTLPFQPSNVQPSLWAGTSHPKSLWAICCLRSATTTNVETEQFSYLHLGFCTITSFLTVVEQPKIYV